MLHKNFYISLVTNSETLASAVIQSSLTGIGLLDHKNRFIEVNDTFCRIYGYEREELIGQPLSVITPSDFRERANLFYQDYVKGLISKGLRQVRRKDGSYTTVYQTSENLDNKAHEQYKLLSVVEMPDVNTLPSQKTGQKAGKSIAENVYVALCRCNRDGAIVFANAAARSLLLIHQGRQHLDHQVFIFSGNIHRELSLVQLLQEKPSFENMELLLTRPGEINVWTLTSAKPVMVEGELHYDISLVNIDALKKLEEKLLGRMDELQEKNKQLDHFVYGATHDLKAPLASVSGLITILRYEKDPDQKDSYLQLMEKSIGRLNEFIKEIVDYSRNSNQELKIEKVDLRALVDEVFEGLEHMSNASSIRKIINVDQKSPFFSDSHRLKVVLNNLISNAYKYSSTHRRDCFIDVHVQSDSKQATIQVEDNGQGISREHMDKIYNMFFRASEGQGGTGLGLYIVKETLSKMQGNIQVASELGKGTRFVVIIPSQLPADKKRQISLDI